MGVGYTGRQMQLGIVGVSDRDNFARAVVQGAKRTCSELERTCTSENVLALGDDACKTLIRK